jgi:hypothetical protein
MFAESGTRKLLGESVLVGVRKRCTLLRFASQDETEANVTEVLPEIAAAMVWEFISARFQPQQN